VVSIIPSGPAGDVSEPRQLADHLPVSVVLPAVGKDRRNRASQPVQQAAAGTAGEMALQAVDGHHGTGCEPQELVQLIGYRDPTARVQSWHRRRRSAPR
jgi:hypothetical protein